MKRASKNGSMCLANCKKCPLKTQCKGCIKTGGRPYGGSCVTADCVRRHGLRSCLECDHAACENRAAIAEEVKALNIEGMPEVDNIFAMAGFILNLEYTGENGETFRLLDNNKIYLGSQVEKEGSDRLIGFAADDEQIVVGEYDNGGGNATLLAHIKRTPQDEATEDAE